MYLFLGKAVDYNSSLVPSIPTQTRRFATTRRDTVRNLEVSETLKHKTLPVIDNDINTSKSCTLNLWFQHKAKLISIAGKMPPSSSRTFSLRSASTASAEDMDVDHLARNKRTIPEATQFSQKKTKQDKCSPGSVKKNKQTLIIFLFKDPLGVEFWLEFQAME